MSNGVELTHYTTESKSYEKTISDNDVPLEDKENRGQQRPPNGDQYPDNEGAVYQNTGEDDDHSLLTETESELDPNYDVDSIASSLGDRLTWRGRMQETLHSTGFHIFVICLVLLDSLIVLFELLLDVGAFGNEHCLRTSDLFIQSEYCHFSQEFSNSCAAPFTPFLCNVPDNTPAFQLNFTTCSNRHIDVAPHICKCGYREGKRVCIALDAAFGVDPAIILHSISIFILFIFVIEFLLKLIAFRLKFFTHKFEVFDACVVFLSFVLDIASLADEEGFQIASLLIILRLWRVVRVVNGVVLSTSARRDAAVHEARGEARKIIHVLHKTQKRLVEEIDEKEKMTKVLEDHGIEYTATEKTVHLKKPVKRKPLVGDKVPV